MQEKMITDSKKITEYDKVVAQRDYWKTEHDKLEIILQEREKNYRQTNSLKDKRIRELEEQLYNRSFSQKRMF